jgi:hypothetical protein
MWQGWTKNLYLLYGGDRSRMLQEVASLWLLDALPYVVFVASAIWFALAPIRYAGILLVVGLFVLTLDREWSYSQALARLGFDSALANYQPLGAALLGALLLGSLRAHRTTGSIQWKGRNYATKGKG